MKVCDCIVLQICADVVEECAILSFRVEAWGKAVV
jgi:hypothetical protein